MTLAALPVLALYAPKALPGLIVILVALALWRRFRERDAWPQVPRSIGAILAGLVGLGAASALWSIDPVASLAMAAKLAGWAFLATVLVALWPPLAARDADLAGWALIGGFAVALILLAIDLNADLAVFRLVRVGGETGETLYAYSLNRGATVLALLLWPVIALCLIRRWAWAAWLAFAASATVIFLSSSGTALVATILGVITFVLARRLGRPIVLLVAGSLAVWLVAAPPVLGPLASSAWLTEAAPQMAPSSFHRLLIWEFVAARIAERPILGWGLDSARRIPGGDENLSVRIVERSALPGDEVHKQTLRGRNFEALPLHPHSLAMQLWLELGAVGALVAAAFVWTVLRATAALRSRIGMASLSATAVAGFVVANLSYGAWQSWWLAALILAIAINCALVRDPAALSPGE
jgi:O-antigen ligase